MKEDVLRFLKEKKPKLCVLATSSIEAKPECAVVGYAVKDDLTIIVSTHKNSRKWNNVKENNKVALCIGWSFTEPYIQCDGVANLIEEGSNYQQSEQFFFYENPDAAKFKTPDTIFIEVKPSWIRFTDFSSHPPKSEELTF